MTAVVAKRTIGCGEFKAKLGRQCGMSEHIGIEYDLLIVNLKHYGQTYKPARFCSPLSHNL
jgi:hypothetical protein